eukprot:8379395-Pyramimonas_sp.AAC.1
MMHDERPWNRRAVAQQLQAVRTAAAMALGATKSDTNGVTRIHRDVLWPGNVQTCHRLSL